MQVTISVWAQTPAGAIQITTGVLHTMRPHIAPLKTVPLSIFRH